MWRFSFTLHPMMPISFSRIGEIVGYQVLKSGKSGWRLIERKFINGERTAKAVPKETFPEIGFKTSMTIEEARNRAKQLTKQSILENRKNIAAVERVKHLKLVDVAYLPKASVAEFEEHLQELTMGMADRYETILKHWSTVQKIIVKLEIDPKDFFTKRYKIYGYFISQQYSLDYTGKLLRILNLWGHFFSKSVDKFFQPVPKPNMNEQQKFLEAREDKVGVRKEAKPLTYDLLKKKKSTFEIAGLIHQWNWLFIALWFGLRPTEVDNLKNTKFWNVSYDPENKIDVLNVFQTKLTSVPKAKRWKVIPIFFEEQKLALKLIESGNFDRPLAKTIAKYVEEGFDNYSPRKGFTDLMLGLGFSLEDISLFLGHSSIDTTWKHYKNKQTFRLPG